MGGRANYGVSKRDFNINTANIGAVGEMLAAADLMKRGYCVFRALSPGSSCDLLIMKHGGVLRVEVTKGHRLLHGELRWRVHDRCKYDLLVVWESNGTITFPEAQPQNN